MKSRDQEIEEAEESLHDAFGSSCHLINGEWLMVDHNFHVSELMAIAIAMLRFVMAHEPDSEEEEPEQ